MVLDWITLFPFFSTRLSPPYSFTDALTPLSLPPSTFQPIFILFLRPQTGNLHLLFLRFPTLTLSILFWRCVVTLSIVLGSLFVLLLLAYLVYALLKAEEF